MPADTATDRGKGIGHPSVTVGVFIFPFCNKRDVASRLRVHGAGLHAREIRLEPFKIDEFLSRSHRYAPDALPSYFLTVRSAVAPEAVTSTDCVVGFPSSLQAFKVYFPAGTFLIS